VECLEAVAVATSGWNHDTVCVDFTHAFVGRGPAGTSERDKKRERRE
jgi:hypothetical protein